MRKATKQETKQVKEYLSNPLTIFTFSKVRLLMNVWHTHIDKELCDRAIDRTAIEHKISILRTHFKL